MKMDKKSLVFSTVALSAVMLSASIGVTSDVQAAERPAVTAQLLSTKNSMKPYYDKNGNYIGDYYINDIGVKIITTLDGCVMPEDDIDEWLTYNNWNNNSKVAVPSSSVTSAVVVSYKEKMDVVIGDTVNVKDFNVKMSDSSKADVTFADGSKTKTFDSLGSKSETILINGDAFTVTISVVAEQAPTITGVHNVKVKRIIAPIGSKWNSYVYDYSIKVNGLVEEEDVPFFKAEKVVLKGVKATDCHGKDITKNIKISGLNKKKYNKKQTVTLSVTDSEGRTTKKTCSVYIKDPVKKMDKYMYIAKQGYWSESPSGYGTKKGSTYFKWMEKVHVVGQHENGYYKVEKNGKYYYILRLSSKHLGNREAYANKYAPDTGECHRVLELKPCKGNAYNADWSADYRFTYDTRPWHYEKKTLLHDEFVDDRSDANDMSNHKTCGARGHKQPNWWDADYMDTNY